MNIGLIGTGAYGQAMAMMLLKNNNDVIMWTENEDKYKFYKENNRIKSLINGVEMPKKIKLTISLFFKSIVLVPITNLLILD